MAPRPLKSPGSTPWLLLALGMLSPGIPHADTVQSASGISTTGFIVTDNISLTTANTTWGYIGSAASYLPQLNAATVSATTVSGTLVSATTLHVRGNTGLGTTAPNVRLDVSGSIVPRRFSAGTSTSIDFSQSNNVSTGAACGAFTLSGMQDGGVYMLLVTGSGTGPATFTHTGLTFKTTATLTCTSAKETIFSLFRAGTNVYVTMNTGF